MSDNKIVKIIKLDASKCTTVADFYNAILPALGAPEWHGGNVNELVESMVWGDINDIDTPYVVQIYSAKNFPSDVMKQMKWTKGDLIKARADYKRREGHDIEVDFQIFD